MFVGKANLGVTGNRTEKVLSLANESDANKTGVPMAKKTLSYNIANDVSFVYTKKPVPHKSGVPYSFKYYVGEKVEIAGYSNHKYETRQARIIGSNVPLVMGQAQLKENLVLDIHLDPGNSGSAVFDERGNLLGMITLSGALRFGSGNLAVSVALPVRTIANALMKLDPVVGSAIFKDMPGEEPEQAQTASVLYQESDLPEDTSPVLPTLSAVPSEAPGAVARLRAMSEAAAGRMIGFVAQQCLVQGTQKPLCHELSVADGRQTYREIERNGRLGKPTDSFPILKHGVWTPSDWMDALGEIADNPWEFQGSVGGHYLFASKSAAEDDRCYYEEYPQGTPLFGGAHSDWKGPVACFEQVLTDKDFNVLSVFTEMRPPDDCLTQLVQIAIYYDWVKLEGLDLPILLPVTERITAEVMGKKHLWYATASWTNYKKFRTEHKIRM
jgi:hypothetical protein